jgi:DNA-binding transcriptional LysR family regulator
MLAEKKVWETIMPTNLPTDLLRSFVAIIDTGSIARATNHIFLTPSALSLQMKRLSELVQAPLFHRRHGNLSLTPTGETLLNYARQILEINDRAVLSLGGEVLHGPVRVGMTQDFADALLSGVIGRFAQLNPQTQLQIQVGNSHDLKDLLSSDLLDIALYLGETSDKAAITIAQIVWGGDANLTSESVLPIVLMEKPCVFRDAALSALEESSRPYRTVLETSSISVLHAAVSGGLGLTCRTKAFLGKEFVPLELPVAPLPKVAYVVSRKTEVHPTVERLGNLLQAAVLDL